MRFVQSAMLLTSIVTFLAGQPMAHSQDTGPKRFRVYIGTYTGGQSKGIYVSEFDSDTGKLLTPKLAAEVAHPSFLAIHPGRKFLYAVNEFLGDPSKAGDGGITAFEIKADGNLNKLNQESARGEAPCHVVVDKTGGFALAANYTSGSVIVRAIGPDGKVGKETTFIKHEGSSVIPGRQSSPHAHAVNLSPDNRFAFVNDLGADKLFVYKFDEKTGSLTPNDPPSVKLAPGAGPRHFALTGDTAYVLNEIDSTITVLRYDASKGSFAEQQSITTLPKGYSGGNGTAEVVIHPSGKFVYASNRGHNSIAVFRRDAASGKLTAAGHQGQAVSVPRNFNIDPTGKYALVGNQDLDNVTVHKIDQETGMLGVPTDKLDVGAPVCIKFMPLP